MNYGNKIFVYEGIPDIYFTAFLSTDLMSRVTLRRYLLPDIMDNGNFKGFFPLILMMRLIHPRMLTHAHTYLCTLTFTFGLNNLLLIFYTAHMHTSLRINEPSSSN